MTKIKKLLPNQLKCECAFSKLDFEDTSKLSKFTGIIGQERAVKAMEYGLRVRVKGYNIYMSGESGTGKTTYAKSYIEKLAKTRKIPDDWCYVYNFNKVNEPIAIKLPAGQGRVLQKDMDDFTKVLKQELSKAFNSEEYVTEKNNELQEFQKNRVSMLEELNLDAEKFGFKVKTTNSGIYFLPIVKGKVLNEDEYSKLDNDLKSEINKKSEELQLQTVEIIRKIKNMEKKSEKKIEEWENKIALFAVGIHITDLKEKYIENKKISDYLVKVQECVLANLNDFIDEEVEESNQPMMMPFLKGEGEDTAIKYKVNLLVDNSHLNGAPVIIDFNPTYYNLLGKMEFINKFGSMSTDFTLIKSGLLHNANGGYIILQIKDIIESPQSWAALKRIIRTKEICIANIKENLGAISGSTMRPEPIPFNAKVILVGTDKLYQLLYAVDEDFKKLFKIKVDFDEEMDRSKKNIIRVAQFIGEYARREGSLHFTKRAVCEVLNYSSRLVENQEKLSTKFSTIVDILSEASTWAEIKDENNVNKEDVQKAILEKTQRSNKYDQKLLEYMKDGIVMIDTKGSKVGQINGLSILNVGDIAFGKPNRITATTYIGESGIVNIEREIEMSGTSHTKGVLILGGYLGQKFAQEFPLSLTCLLCFEQMYSGIDGDSASSTELYSILSSLSEVPIKQGIAVTGSVNQKGEIQPIGGATMKIEGFFTLCKAQGLSGDQGVIIPSKNINNLVLSDEVIKAVGKKKFHIYTIDTIDQGIEILTGLTAGIKDENGEYKKGTINYMVNEKLKHYAKMVSKHVKS